MIDYETDFYGWSQDQAAMLRAGRAAELDWPHLAEEIESMGRSEQEQLTNRLAVLLAHLLKWNYQTDLRSNSWRLTIAEQRRRIVRHMRKNPSLQAVVTEVMADAYGDALLMAERETGLSEATFPAACPWTLEEALAA